MSTRWIMHFDGLCEPNNPGGTMGFGCTLSAGTMGEHADGGYLPARPENTNNVAEYAALHLGLTKALALRTTAGDAYPGLAIHGDSQLVCNQVVGRWKTNTPRLQAARAACIALIEQLRPFHVEWIPREMNTAADELSRQAYRVATGREPPERVKGRKAAG